MSSRQTIADKQAFEQFLKRCEQAPEILDVPIQEVSLLSFDQLFEYAGGCAMNRAIDVKAELTQSLKYLHLPTVRQCYEELAQQAERESLSYERYLHELIQRECEERQENRITKMLRESQLPLEKSLAAFDTKRLPSKAARQMRSLLDGASLREPKTYWFSEIPAAARRTCYRPSAKSWSDKDTACCFQLRDARAASCWPPNET